MNRDAWDELARLADEELFVWLCRVLVVGGILL